MSMLSQQNYAGLPHFSHAFQPDVLPNYKRKVSDVESHEGIGSTNPVRRRITRACDQCNQLRTKCDGKQPCAHCVDVRISCEYARTYKKRGRIPKDELHSGRASGDRSHSTHEYGRGQKPATARQHSLSESGSGRDDEESRFQDDRASEGRRTSQLDQNHSDLSNNINLRSYDGDNPSVNVSNISSFLNPVQNTSYYNGGAFGGIESSQIHDTSAQLGSGTQGYSTLGLNTVPQEFGFPLGDDYSVAFMGKAPMVESPDWLSLASPAFMAEAQPIPLASNFEEPLRYPVIRPLLPHISSILPTSLACDLLEQYFGSTTSAYLRPSNPYVLGYVFRKTSILHPSSPRRCTPALLASMLWISAQTSDAAFLNTQPDSRSRICQRLLELTINLLKPLVHSQSSAPTSDHATRQSADDASLGALVGVHTSHISSHDYTQVDNIATYIHLATVVSASERKAASLRWWNAAWSLAREVRLGRELPPNPPESGSTDRDKTANDNHESTGLQQASSSHRRDAALSQPHIKKFFHEEEREERRRVWWLLYMMDRHLALCYNRPMFFLNKECEALLQPMSDDAWQSGNFEQASSMKRNRGLNVDCVAHSVFGYFLPLMVILGEILDLNHARNRPRFGPGTKRVKTWDSDTREILELLESYGQSLHDFTNSSNSGLGPTYNSAIAPAVVSAATNESYAKSEASLQTKTVVAYGTHIMHVLHILLTGKWDPIALLDDNDLWISSQSFVTATGHAVNAADAVSNIIEYDPDLSFMPFFFGVYLLQGSFLLLLFADKLQGTVSPEVVRACETIVRAHEACVATLDTQYQRNFRKVMRSALQQVRGRIPEDLAEQQHRRREVLALYRWTGDGTGLAL